MRHAMLGTNRGARLKAASRSDILARLLAAGLGGYLAAWAGIFALSSCLTLPRASIWYLSYQIAPLPLLLAVLWAFTARSSARAWAAPLAFAAVCGAIALVGKWLT